MITSTSTTQITQITQAILAHNGNIIVDPDTGKFQRIGQIDTNVARFLSSHPKLRVINTWMMRQKHGSNFNKIKKYLEELEEERKEG